MAYTIANLSRPGRFEKLQTAMNQVKACVWEWVVENRSIRELDQRERLAKMSENLERFGSFSDNRPKSKRDSYLPPINVCGERELMPRSEVWTSKMKYQCLVEAREFCAQL